ncbi:prolactin receptor-like [Branchiostoma floridae x Branchiostoma belcheri]
MHLGWNTCSYLVTFLLATLCQGASIFRFPVGVEEVSSYPTDAFTSGTPTVSRPAAHLALHRELVAAVGSTVLLNCTGRDPAGPRGATWQHNGRKLAPPRRDPAGHPAAQLRLEDVTVEDSGTYLCLVDGKVRTQVVLKIGSKPQVPKIPDCISTNADTFRCTWSVEDSDLETQYRLFYSFNDGRRIRHECPEYESVDSCYFGYDHAYLNTRYRFELQATNALGSATSRPYYVDPTTERVKPDPPCDVHTRLRHNDGTKVKVSWRSPRDILFLSLQYELQYRSENDQKDDWTVQETGEQSNFLLLGLEPNTRHFLRVRCKPVLGGFWSKFSDVTEIMTRDKPRHHHHLT